MRQFIGISIVMVAFAFVVFCVIRTA